MKGLFHIRWIISGFILLTAAFVAMAIDPVDNGFGWLTLWFAPPVLVAGLFSMVPGILGGLNLSLMSQIRLKWSADPFRHIAALIVFLFSLVVYVLTLEPTASLWDCSEFIATAYKLQVPHTPGTPLALILGRMFSMLAFGDGTRVAWSINLMSAIFSALTIYVCFNLFYLAAQRIFASPWACIAGSAIGSLCLAFSDTFWFSAVEAETYATACFVLSLLVWLIIKGNSFEGKDRSRWLVLIFYMAGLGYCIHPMCLLSLPLLPVVWLLKGKALTLMRVSGALTIGLGLILFINRFIAVGIFEVSFSFDRLFVNSLGAPFYSGAIFFLLLAGLGVFVSLKKYPSSSTYIFCLLFLLAGFSPYLMLFIRSSHNPPIDESNPENLPLVKAYMNREGYPTRPLLFGPYFDAEITSMKKVKDSYYRAENSYEVAGSLSEYDYDKRQTVLPRIYSNDEDHIESYRRWTGLAPNQRPDFGDNISFMLRYQLGHMYLRYIMFNFAGRAGDIQNSDWLRPWEKLYDESQINHSKARNQYFMIPLLLALVGMIAQFRKHKAGFFTVTILFLLTGIVLVLYLNSTPNEPRERDYIYVGSYIAFAAWIAIGIAYLITISRPAWARIAVALTLSMLPLWMLGQNYNDHNRAGRTFQIDHARAVLSSCAPNSILFTGGDNDTFPLWYLQEVEGWRTDVRVMVLSYMNTDWYINQLRKGYYESPAFQLSLGRDAYRQYGPNDALYVQDQIAGGIDAQKYLSLLEKRHPGLSLKGNGDPISLLPSKTLNITLARATESPMVMSRDSGRSTVSLQVTGNYLFKNSLAILDVMTSNPERPVYFNFTSMNQIGLNLQKFLIQEGEVYRVDLYKKSDGADIDTGKMYDNLIRKANYSNLLDQDVNFNYEDFLLRMISPLRQSFNVLAMALLQEGDLPKAQAVMDHAIAHLYAPHLKPTFTDLQTADLLFKMKRNDDAKLVAQRLWEWTNAGIEEAKQKGKSAEEYELYLLQNSAELLSLLSDSNSLETVTPHEPSAR